MNSIPRKLLIPLFCLAMSVYSKPVTASPMFQPGYIITNQNDTLHGSIKDRKIDMFEKLYKKIRFKTKGPFARRYGPAQIKGYRVGDSVFESMWLHTSREFFREEYTSQPGLGQRQFLKLVYQGEHLSYYHLEHIDHDSGTVDYIPLFKKSHDTRLIRVSQGIMGLRKKALAEYFSDCPGLAGRITRGELKNSLEIVDNYNQYMQGLEL
jgi:hypothetical protein